LSRAEKMKSKNNELARREILQVGRFLKTRGGESAVSLIGRRRHLVFDRRVGSATN